MAYQYEVIKYQGDSPIRIFTQTVETFPYHWHEDIEILLVLEGALEIRVNRMSYPMNEGDLFLVNPNELHFIKSDAAYGKTQLLALQFNTEYLEKYNLDITSRRFNMYSRDGGMKEEHIQKMRYMLAQLMTLGINKSKYYHLRVQQILIEMIILLTTHFEVQIPQNNITIEKDERLAEILKYMNEVCTQPHIGLGELAEYFGMNPQYLSKYFKNQVGITLKKFLDQMRLNKSLKALMMSDERILDVALAFGFPDAKAYYRVFKEVIGITPLQYRDQYKIEIDNKLSFNYFNMNSQETLKKLFAYLEISPLKDTLESVCYEKTVRIDKEGKRFPKNFKSLMTFGCAAHGLRRDFGEQLEMIQKEIGFEYVRFHGIFSDELGVVTRLEDGSLQFNFKEIDSLFDKLIKVGLKPFLELGFMPEALASEKKRIFLMKHNVSAPICMEEWSLLIDTFMRHLINRYGIEEVRTWYFECWNEPEVKGAFWSGTKEQFFELYKVTYLTIKRVDKALQIGGFGNILVEENEQWLSTFNDYAKVNEIQLDFFSCHTYNMVYELPDNLKNLSKEVKKITDMIRHLGVRYGEPNYMSQKIDKILRKVDKLERVRKNYWITEWNASFDERNWVHDTCYMGPYVIKTILENQHKVKGMGFWTFTDLFAETKVWDSLFHGGFGLLTYNGIKKPSYHGYFFLSKLGDTVIHEEEGCIVTKKGEDIQLLFYNYCHTNELYSYLDYSQLTMHNRYQVFEREKEVRYNLLLEGLTGTYTMKSYTCDRENGSAFDAWVRMGGIEPLDDEAVAFLRHQAEPTLQIEQINAEGSYPIDIVIQPHGMKLILLSKRY